MSLRRYKPGGLKDRRMYSRILTIFWLSLSFFLIKCSSTTWKSGSLRPNEVSFFLRKPSHPLISKQVFTKKLNETKIRIDNYLKQPAQAWYLSLLLPVNITSIMMMFKLSRNKTLPMRIAYWISCDYIRLSDTPKQSYIC